MVHREKTAFIDGFSLNRPDITGRARVFQSFWTYRFAVVWVLLLLSVGCTKQIRPEKEVVKKDASLEELLNLYRLRRDAVPPFKGLMEVAAHFPKQGRHTVQASVRSEGNLLRFRAFNLFGGTLFDLTVEGPDVSLTIPSEKRTFQGTREELEAQIQTEIPAGAIDLLEWIRRGGGPEVVPPFIPALEKGDDFFILYLFLTDGIEGDLVEKIWIERTAFHVTKVEYLDPEGTLSAVMALDDYRNVGGHDFPFSIEGKSGGEKISVKFKEISPLSREKP